MKRTKIAPHLRDLFRETPHDAHMPEYAPASAELRALLAVVRAVRAWFPAHDHSCHECRRIEAALARLSRKRGERTR